MSQHTEIAKNKKAQRISSPFAKRLFTLKEAAIYLGRSQYGVRTLIWNGNLPVIKNPDGATNSRKQWIDVVDLDLFIERNKETVQ